MGIPKDNPECPGKNQKNRNCSGMRLDFFSKPVYLCPRLEQRRDFGSTRQSWCIVPKDITTGGLVLPFAKNLDHFFIFQKNSLHLKMANFSSLKRRSIFTSRKILREKLELHSASKKSLNIAKMVEKRFELPTSTHDLSYEKIRLADCHKIPIFSDKSENPHARVTGVHKFLTFTPPSVPGDNREASHQEMKPL